MSKDKDEIETPVYFEFRGKVYKGRAHYASSWPYITISGRRFAGGDWDYQQAFRDLGDDKIELNEGQLIELRCGRSVQVAIINEEISEVSPGEYTPPGDGSTQSLLFGDSE